MRNNGEQDVSKVTTMDRMFYLATAFGSDVSAWVRHCCPTIFCTFEHLFYFMVSRPRCVFPYKHAHFSEWCVVTDDGLRNNGEQDVSNVINKYREMYLIFEGAAGIWPL